MAEKKIKVEYQPISRLLPYAQNARTHSPEQIKIIAASIREFGFVNPVLIDVDNNIIAGHGRVQAAQSIGVIDIPVIRLGGLSEAQVMALRIADNSIALTSARMVDEVDAARRRSIAALWKAAIAAAPSCAGGAVATTRCGESGGILWVRTLASSFDHAASKDASVA